MVKQKLINLFKPNKEDKFIKHVENYRKKYIPERYNQVRLFDFLQDEDIDHYVSISNRADGKSYNYCSLALDLAIEYGINFTFIVRRFTVRTAGQKLFQKIIDTNDRFNPQDFVFRSTNRYIILIYKGRHVGIFTDLNEATDLKYESNYLVDFPLIIYDEFLALKGDYLIDEWDKLMTIYSSINRETDDIPIIKFPKILYLGNAVNFSSPILAHLDLFNLLEKQEMNTIKKHGNIIVELNKNEKANEQRNLRAFNEKNDPMAQAKFKINKHNIADDNDWARINKQPNFFYVKLREYYLRVTYNTETYESILSIRSFCENYEFNTQLKDNTENSIFLNDTYYDDEHIRFYNRNLFLFDNMYSKDTILDYMENTMNIRINKLIRKHATLTKKSNIDIKEKVYNYNYIENSKKAIFERFFND